jgi:sigma-B regulation protein RsbU (phosphoserine phosphatase)
MARGQAPTTPPAYLVPLTGPNLDPFTLAPTPDGQVLGRHEDCPLRLPAEADKVSRRHARFAYVGGMWRVMDLGSRWGTFVNGDKLAPNADMPLAEGDLIRVVPWTFMFASSPKRRPQVRPTEDAGQTMVRTIGADQGRQLQGDLLALLLEGTATLHNATGEKELADAVIDLATRGTGLPNAALLRPVDSAGGVDVISARFSESAKGVSFSRSLLSVALDGQVAEVTSDAENVSASIVQMRINSAMCVPLKLGETVAALLYLDSRTPRTIPRSPHAGAFAVALGRMASLAMANLKRIEVERRSAAVDAELSAAAAAQKWILPKRDTVAGQFTVTGESRAGQYVGGDFFDVIDLGNGKVAIALGDVSGHGVAASVLMTATQGYLHASLREHADAARAVTAVNRYVSPRRDGSTFVTAWVGVFDAPAMTLSYVDAGHGYVLLRDGASSAIAKLDEGTGAPIGIMDDFEFSAVTVPLTPGGRVLLVSDGILEQFGVTEPREQFGFERVRDVLSGPSTDPVTDLFRAVVEHSQTDKLSDDATAVLVEW